MRRFTLALLVLALAVRILVPSGWMPSGERAFALTVCTGINTQTIWMDSKGGLHKQNPDDHEQAGHDPCTFSAATDVMPVAQAGRYEPEFALATAAHPSRTRLVGIGRGLAAPPPPQTGPPVLI